MLASLDQRSASSTKRIQKQIVFGQAECLDVFPDQMRGIREYKTIPVMNRQILFLNRINCAIPGLFAFDCCNLHFVQQILHFLENSARRFATLECDDSGDYFSVEKRIMKSFDRLAELC
jgi:hypothetical protein